MAHSYSTLTAKVLLALQMLEAELEGGLSNSDAVEARAYQDTLRDVRRLQTIQNGTTIRPDPAAVAPIALLTSSARTADTPTADQTGTGRALIAVLDVTAGAGTITALQLQRKNPTGTYTTVATATPASPVGNEVMRYVFVFAPGGVNFATPLKFSAGASSFAFPQTWRINVDHTDGTSVTYALDGFLIR